MRARDELMWIDQVANDVRKKNLFYSNSALENKAKALFFDSESACGELPSPVETSKRQKRNSSKIEKPESQGKPALPREALPRKDEKFNFSPAKSGQLALERLLGSINVFPVAVESQSNDDVAKNDDPELADAAGSKVEIEIGYESNDSFGEMRLGRSLKSVPMLDAAFSGNNFTKLLLHDNPNDYSQMYRALHGDLAYDIVNAVFAQVKSNKEIRPSNDYEENHSENSLEFVKIEDTHHQVSNSESNESSVTKKLMNFVEQLMTEEIEKKSCGALPPDLHAFLHWLLEIQSDEGKFNIAGKSLAQIEASKSKNNPLSNLDEWYRKAETLRNLLNEYDELSRRDRNKVQAIYEYLATRLEFVEAYIESYRSHLTP